MSCIYWYVTVAYVCIPRSFLEITVCSLGKNLCTPCIYIYVYYFSCLWINTQHVWNDTKLGREKCSKNPVPMPLFFPSKIPNWLVLPLLYQVSFHNIVFVAFVSYEIEILSNLSMTMIEQGVQLKSEPYFNMCNLFTTIYNMLYYTTNLYLQ